ncbi:type IV secretory system conjugative DNA transfer family protein [Maritalea sp.]|uniref:type IV secretory system conjugative DNA transfer family protein n=1 Tax=Maritalea sp. TaxID=2003361 RepID=UPI003EF18B53
MSFFDINIEQDSSFTAFLSSSLDAFRWSPVALSADPMALMQAWGLGVLTAAATFVAGIGLLSLTLDRPKVKDGHGTAKWATREDCVEAGLLDNNPTGTSLIVGGWLEPDAKKGTVPEYLIYTGAVSVLAFAPSGSSKSVSLAIPNLNSYESSSFVVDLKKDLWKNSAGYRKYELGHRVMFHDPSQMEKGGVRFNSLEEIDIEKNTAVKEAQMQAEYLIPSSPKQSGEDNKSHFEQSARSLLVGVILYELTMANENGSPIPSVNYLLSQVTNPELPFKEYLLEMTKFQVGPAVVSKVIREIATEQAAKEDKEFNAVLSSMTTPLSKFRDPILAAATERSDFKILDLVDEENPTDLYLVLRPSDRDRLSNYISMFINILYRKLTEETGGYGNMRRELLLMLDEFSSLPALPVVQQSMDVMRGYGLKALIILQDVESLNRLYGQYETFTSNTTVKIAYTPNKPKTAQLLSTMVGTTTITEHTRSSSTKTMGIVPNSSNKNEGIHGRPLLTPDEISRMKVATVDSEQRLTEAGDALIFMTGKPPIKGVQTPYFFNEELLRRSKIPPPTVSDICNNTRQSPATTTGSSSNQNLGAGNG